MWYVVLFKLLVLLKFLNAHWTLFQIKSSLFFFLYIMKIIIHWPRLDAYQATETNVGEIRHKNEIQHCIQLAICENIISNSYIPEQELGSWNAFVPAISSIRLAAQCVYFRRCVSSN